MIFANPSYFWLFLIFIPLIVWYVMKQKNATPSMLISTTKAFDKVGTSWKVWLRHFMFVLRLAAIGCVIVILARPQTRDRWQTEETEGTDIVLALDFRPDRFEAAKEVASKFIAGRETDNIGIVIFSGESFTLVPMTSDKAVLLNYVQDIKMGMLEDGTAIGDGLATAINRIKGGKAKSKSIILLTDGSNNTGIVAPLTAAEIARRMGVKVYTIGVGTNGEAEFPIGRNIYGKVEYQLMPVVIDEVTLKKIANTTGGAYFRATDKSTLNDIFNEIDKLEKTKMDVKQFSHTEDNYLPWALALLALVIVELLARNTILRNIP